MTSFVLENLTALGRKKMEFDKISDQFTSIETIIIILKAGAQNSCMGVR